MKQRQSLATGVLVAVLLIPGLRAFADGASPDEADLWFEGVLKREADVFASTPAGVYRATLATKSWVKLQTPPEMPPCGNFVTVPEGSPLVIYVARRMNPRATVNDRFRYGIYLSKD